MVGTPQQPNYTTDTGTTYPLNIDSALSVVKQIGDQGAVYENSTPNMTVRMKGLRYVSASGTWINVVDNVTTTIPAPTVNPRIDTIVLSLDTNGFLRLQGAEAASPVPPTLNSAQIPLADIALSVGQVAIVNANITDRRPLISAQLLWWLLNRANTWSQSQNFNGQDVFDVSWSDDGASAGPFVDARRISTSPAANDLLAMWRWLGRSSTGVERVYAAMYAQIDDPTNASEDAQLIWQTIIAGTITTRMRLAGGLQLGAPTGGDLGIGWLNAASGLAVNNIFKVDNTGKMVGGTVPLARMTRTLVSVSNFATVPSNAVTGVVFLDLGTVNVGDEINVTAVVFGSGSPLTVSQFFHVQKWTGTALFHADTPGPQANTKNDSASIAQTLSGQIRIATGGTLVLRVAVSQNSGGDVDYTCNFTARVCRAD